ncbi:hypothetical protein ACHAXR_009334 [Thalassiosira sp. AJA248-18]
MNSWCVANVTDMSTLFFDATSFNEDISAWYVSSVTEMGYMFGDGEAFNGNLSTWDVLSVTDLHWMFLSATSFNGDLSNWDVSSVTIMKSMCSKVPHRSTVTYPIGVFQNQHLDTNRFMELQVQPHHRQQRTSRFMHLHLSSYLFLSNWESSHSLVLFLWYWAL